MASDERSDPGSPGQAGTGELPIAEHGLIGDMHTAALVGTNGTIDWYCPGRFDAPSLFAGILDHERGGSWALHPDGDGWTSRQLYLPDTTVLLTRFSSEAGVVEVADFMPVDEIDGSRGIVRRVQAVRGRVPLVCELVPRPDYARAAVTIESCDGGAWCHWEARDGQVDGVTLTTDADLEIVDHGLRGRIELDQGESATFLLLDGDHRAAGHDEATAQGAHAATIAWWRDWLAQSTYRGRWREMVLRSAMTLKLLTYAPTGALVAAPTTSLPEQVGGERNWDYRYTWIRDAAFSLYALLRLGFTSEAGAFVAWLAERVRHRDTDDDTPPLQVLYTVDGRADVPERRLDHLAGHAGSTPVRVGNAAAEQLQLDIFGEVIDSMYLHDKHGTPLFARDWMDVTEMVDWVCDNWDQPDEGIWEVRSGRHRFTHSRLMSWVAIERAMRVARDRGLPADLVRWGEVRDEIWHQLMERAWDDEVGAFTQHYDTDTVDAAVLLMPLVKFISPTDPRWLATLDAIERVLVSDSLVHRYDPEVAPDGLAGEEGTFSMCTFWYVEALTRAGRVDRARLVFDKMLTYANHLGLYAEQVGPRGEQLGNFPQAFTHLSLISAAFDLDRAVGDTRA